MSETLTYGYTSESTQREPSDEYQHDRFLEDFQESLLSCAFNENCISIGRVMNIRCHNNDLCKGVCMKCHIDIALILPYGYARCCFRNRFRVEISGMCTLRQLHEYSILEMKKEHICLKNSCPPRIQPQLQYLAVFICFAVWFIYLLHMTQREGLQPQLLSINHQSELPVTPSWSYPSRMVSTCWLARAVI